MGRAIVRRPAVFLFDEPLSNLDAALRSQVRVQLQKLHRQLGTTSVYVTHDQVEAMTLGSRLAVLRGGELQQVGRPLEVFQRPDNRFVAGFLGSPAMNFLKATVRSQGGRLRGDGQGFSLELPAGATVREGQAVFLGVRPQDLALAPAGSEGLCGTVETVELVGWEAFILLKVGDATVTVRVEAPVAAGLTVGQALTVVLAQPAGLLLFDSESQKALRPAPASGLAAHAG